MGDFAARSSQQPDSKTQTLIDWLNRNLKPKASWNTERVIIFTEYRATQKWLYDLLARHGFAEEGRLELIYGGMPSDQSVGDHATESDRTAKGVIHSALERAGHVLQDGHAAGAVSTGYTELMCASCIV